MDWQNAIFGPGWVWSMLSMVLVVGSLLGLYRQLQLQHDAAATEQLNSLLGEWSSERMCRAKLTVLLAIEAGVAPEQLPHRAVSHVGFFWQRIGYLVRTGHMDRKLVHRHLGPQVQMWRAWLGPKDWEDFVWMAETSAAMDAAQKVAPWLTRRSLRSSCPRASRTSATLSSSRRLSEPSPCASRQHRFRFAPSVARRSHVDRLTGDFPGRRTRRRVDGFERGVVHPRSSRYRVSGPNGSRAISRPQRSPLGQSCPGSAAPRPFRRPASCPRLRGSCSGWSAPCRTGR